MKTHKRIRNAKYIKLFFCDRDLNTELNRYNGTKGCVYAFYYRNKRTKTKTKPRVVIRNAGSL